MKKSILLLSTSLLLSGCFSGTQSFQKIEFPSFWGSDDGGKTASVIDAKALEKWWEKFNDPALNALIELAMMDSPDRLIAQARIREARGIRKNTRSSLFPQLGLSASGGRQDNGATAVDDYYEAAFDASFEIDVFGKNRKNLNAADAQIKALEAQYDVVTLTLIGDIARSYIDYRAAQKQAAIAQKNLTAQEKTLELIKQQFEFGEAPQLDVERADTIVNSTRSSIPEFERLADNSRLQLSVLTGQFPQALQTYLSDTAEIPMNPTGAVLMAPAQVLAVRPDIRVASATLAANTSLAESVTAELFPSFTLSGLFGVTENVLTSSTNIWNAALGTAVSLLDFGRIEGRIDAARAREVQAYQQYRKTILAAVSEVETAFIDVARINEQRVSLQNAYDSAQKSFTLSETLYKEGEISFLDVLDAQRTVNEADSAVIGAQAAHVQSLVRLYKSLGRY